MARPLTAVSAVLLCLGCASLPSPEETAPNLATAVVLWGTRDQAFEIARDSLLAVGITPKKGSAAEGFIAGDHGITAWWWDERVGVYFRERYDGAIVIWVVAKRKLSTNVSAPGWTAPVLAQIRSRVAASAAPTYSD
jgi:hypothetical protein